MKWIIKTASRFLQTDLLYLARGSFWIAVGKFAGMIVALALSVAYARYLPRSVYGDYRYILSILGIVSVFALPGMGAAIVRAVAYRKSEILRTSTRLRMITSLGISFVALIAAIISLLNDNNILFWGFLIATPIVPFTKALGGWRPYMDGLRRFREKTSYNVVAHIFNGVLLLGTVFVIYFFKLPLVISAGTLVGSYLLGKGIPNAFFFKKIIGRIIKKSVRYDDNIRYGIHLSLSNISSTVATYLDGILLFHFLGPVSLAAYSFAIALPEQLKAVMGSAIGVSLPKLAEKTANANTFREMRRTLIKKALRVSLMSLVIVGGYILTAPYIFGLFFPRYISSVLLSQIFAVSLILYPFGILSTAIVAEGNIKKVYWYRFGTPIAQIMALIILVPLFGLWGAIAGRIFGRFFNHLISFTLFKYF